MRKNSTLIACSIVVISLGALVAACSSGGSEPSGGAPSDPSVEDGADEGRADEDEVDEDGAEGDGAEEDGAVPDAAERAALAGAVVFSVSDKFTLYDDGPGVVNLAGVVQVGVLRPGDGLEILGGGPDTGTTILAIRVGVPAVEVDSLAPGEFGYLVVAGDLDDFSFTEQLVRPVD